MLLSVWKNRYVKETNVAATRKPNL